MLRWALKGIDIDTRCSFLYMVSNCTNVKLIGQKHCKRFFNSVRENPRFITDFISKVSNSVDFDLLGISALVWWPEVEQLYSR